MADKPIKKFRIGFIQAAVWKNDGTNNPFYTVTLQRSYKDDNGQLQNTEQLGAADLLNAAELLKRAEQHIATLV